MAHETQLERDGRNDSPVKRRLRLGAKLVMPLLVLAVAAGAALYLMETSPRAERAEKPRQARLVETMLAERQDHEVVLEAWGQVRPAREVALKAEVTGRVIAVSPKLTPGGRFKKGEMVLKIDPSDYELAVRQRESDVAKARADLQIEQGNQVIARRESELLKDDLSERERNLVLRQPQLSTAQANVAAAEAALAEARLALERATVRAPFDAIVISRQADIGTQLTTAVDIATFAGTETYWVELAVPTSELRWIDVPARSGAEGSPVRLHNDAVWGPNVLRRGRVIRLLGDLTSEGRMARLLVAVDDPLATTVEHRGQPPLLIGAYLRAAIGGRIIENALALDRAALRDGDKVWVMNDAGNLEVRDVTLALRGARRVFITNGIKEGERVVVSNIGGAIPGMPLRTQGGTENPRLPDDRNKAASSGQSTGAPR